MFTPHTLLATCLSRYPPRPPPLPFFLLPLPLLSQSKADKTTIDQLKRDQIEAESLARKQSDEIERLKKLLGEATAAKAAVDTAMGLLTAGKG